MCGDRFVEALLAEIKQLESKENEKVKQVSFMGYSMGGLVVQYAVGKLHKSGFFSTTELINIVCIAAPRLGAHVISASPRAWLFNRIAPIISSRSGRQLFFEDSWAHSRPLISLMADPNLCFYQGLLKAKRLINMSNIQFDTMVGYRLSAMIDESPYEEGRGFFWFFKGHATKGLKEGYPSIVVPPSDSKGRAEWGHPRTIVDGLWFRILALLLFFPLLLPLLLIFLPISIIRGAWHYSSFKLPSDHNLWLDKEDGLEMISMSGTTVDDAHIVVDVPGYGSTRKTRVENQEWVKACLKTLPWQQIDVDCRHAWAHAAIVVRHPSRFKHRDQLDYLVKEAILWQ